VDEKVGDKVFRTRSSAQLSDVDLTFALAREGDFVAVKGKKVIPGPNATLPVEDPLEALFKRRGASGA